MRLPEVSFSAINLVDRIPGAVVTGVHHIKK